MEFKDKVDTIELQVSEFQLTELEERLEMIASQSSYCCECFRQVRCQPM